MPVIVSSVLVGEVIACCLFTIWNRFSFHRTIVDIRGNASLWAGTTLISALALWLLMSG
jgi:hypothetical protein